MGMFLIPQQSKALGREQKRAILCKERACCSRNTVRLITNLFQRVQKGVQPPMCPPTSEGLSSAQEIWYFAETTLTKVCTAWKSIKGVMPADSIGGVSGVAISSKNAPSPAHLKVSETVHSPSAISMISSTRSQQKIELSLYRVTIPSCFKSTSALYPFTARCLYFHSAYLSSSYVSAARHR